MKDLPRFLLDAANSGVYGAPGPVASFAQGARASGLACFDLDLADVTGKAAFLARCQMVFGLPPSFGQNWDALADCLEDFSWRPARGYVVLVTNGTAFAKHAAHDFDTALEILGAAATYWLAKGRPFVVVLDAATCAGRAVKSLPR